MKKRSLVLLVVLFLCASVLLLSPDTSVSQRSSGDVSVFSEDVVVDNSLAAVLEELESNETPMPIVNGGDKQSGFSTSPTNDDVVSEEVVEDTPVEQENAGGEVSEVVEQVVEEVPQEVVSEPVEEVTTDVTNEEHVDTQFTNQDTEIAQRDNQQENVVISQATRPAVKTPKNLEQQRLKRDGNQVWQEELVRLEPVTKEVERFTTCSADNASCKPERYTEIVVDEEADWIPVYKKVRANHYIIDGKEVDKYRERSGCFICPTDESLLTCYAYEDGFSEDIADEWKCECKSGASCKQERTSGQKISERSDVGVI